MNLKITEFPTGARPNVPQPSGEIFKYLGEEGIRKLVNDHYNLLVKSAIKHLFPPAGEELELAKKYSADFFIQRFGGPAYYDKSRGKPMLTKRHEPFAINQDARKAWLNCYKKLLLELDLPEKTIINYWNFLDIFSIWMVNTIDINTSISMD